MELKPENGNLAEDEWTEASEVVEVAAVMATSRPQFSRSMWIWCPKDVITTKVKDATGRIVIKEVGNSVGPRQHINRCLRCGCCCKALEDRIQFIYGD